MYIVRQEVTALHELNLRHCCNNYRQNIYTDTHFLKQSGRHVHIWWRHLQPLCSRNFVFLLTVHACFTKLTSNACLAEARRTFGCLFWTVIIPQPRTHWLPFSRSVKSKAHYDDLFQVESLVIRKPCIRRFNSLVAMNTSVFVVCQVLSSLLMYRVAGTLLWRNLPCWCVQ